MTTQKQILEFEDYLLKLGYNSKTVYGTVRYFKRFVKFLNEGRLSIYNSISIQEVLMKIDKEGNYLNGNSLSSIHYNGYLYALRKYSKYQQNVFQKAIPLNRFEFKKVETPEKIVLTKEEILELYNVTHSTSRLGYRDRAMLSVYYGAGLRKEEGASLRISDIDFKEQLLFVRNGKGGKSRYVPISSKSSESLSSYVKKGRPLFVRDKKVRSVLFLNSKGMPLGGGGMYRRLKKLVNETTISKSVGLHTLRHSIATHLLDNNMPIEDIAKFLGHSTIESTEIYTHVKSESIIQKLSER